MITFGFGINSVSNVHFQRHSILPEHHGAQNGPSSNTPGHKIGDSIGKSPASEPVAFNATTGSSSEATASQVLPRLSTLSDSRHELCYNWIRGHCKFESNCRRLHQMPRTTEEWQDIVLRGILHRGGNSKGVDSPQNVADHSKPRSQLDVLNRDIVYLRQELANQSHMRKARHQKPSRTGVREIEARLIQKVLDDEDVKRSLDREAKLGREQGHNDATPIGKQRKEVNSTQTARTQPVVSTTDGVRTGHLVDVK